MALAVQKKGGHSRAGHQEDDCMSVETGPISCYNRKRAAERLEFADAGDIPAKRRESTCKGSREKMGTVTWKFLDDGAEKCQHEER